MAIPGLFRVDHFGFTVPDIQQATAFLVDIFDCEVVSEQGPFLSEDNWMADQLAVDPRSVIRKVRMLKCRDGARIELFEYEASQQVTTPPRNSDIGGNHVSFSVADISAAKTYLEQKGVTVLGSSVDSPAGGGRTIRWIYFQTPWGTSMELCQYLANVG